MGCEHGYEQQLERMEAAEFHSMRVLADITPQERLSEMVTIWRSIRERFSRDKEDLLAKCRKRADEWPKELGAGPQPRSTAECAGFFEVFTNWLIEGDDTAKDEALKFIYTGMLRKLERDGVLESMTADCIIRQGGDL